MKRSLVLGAMALLLLAPLLHAAPILGDFDSEIRRADGHIDADATIRALKDLGANTYFYLIWHSRFDWDDLPAFADAAARQGISVWVYLVPWSETPLVKQSIGFSEPFRTDFVRWAQEIARLSLDHRNIAGYVIDDFYTNTQPERLSVPYVRRMVRAGREINPRIKFYGLVYFQQPWEEFVERFGGVIDGVVAAYPKSRLQIGNALAYLNDEPHGASAIIDVPRAPTRAGDIGSIWADLRVNNAREATVSFYWDDDDHTTQRGYHTAFVRVDGRTIWRADTAGRADDRVIELPLDRVVRDGQQVRIEMGLTESRPVAKYNVRVKFDDIRVTGFDTPELTREALWSRRQVGPIEVNVTSASKRKGELSMPMILMPAGDPAQHEKRYPEPGSPRNIAAKVSLCLDMLRRGRVEGVVTYCLPKERASAVFDAVTAEYRRFNPETPER